MGFNYYRIPANPLHAMPDPTNPLNYINPFSRCVVHLTMDFGGERIATGTGFIRQRQGERFLITAWHNLSGREPATLRPKHRQGALPNYVTIEGFNITIRCPLYHDDDPNDEVHCQRCFWQHPLGPTLDVAVLQNIVVVQCRASYRRKFF